MKFEDVYGRWRELRLNQAEAAEILGMSERTFRRWRDRYDEGAAGLLDRRLGKASARRVSVDQIDQTPPILDRRARAPSARLFRVGCVDPDGSTWAGENQVHRRRRDGHGRLLQENEEPMYAAVACALDMVPRRSGTASWQVRAGLDYRPVARA